MKSRIQHIALLLFFLALISCMKDDELWKRRPVLHDPASQGLFIINEGNFGYENASLSYYDIEKKKLYNDVFFNTNGLPLGDVALSMEIFDSTGYVVLNGSGKIYTIDVNTFELSGKITGLTSPRYIHFIDETKAYVTDLYARSISIIDPGINVINGSIDVNNNDPLYYQHPTEQLLLHNDLVYTNCWSFDNKILIIDSKTDVLVDSIEVFIQPQSMAMDAYGYLWVLTDGGFNGNPYGHEEPALMRIDLVTNEVVRVFRFDLNDLPSELTINGTGDTLYFLNRHVYRHAVSSINVPEIFVESPYQNASGGYYGLAVDPQRSDIYVADAVDLVQSGVVYRYRASGMPLDTMRVGVIPGSFCFK